MRSFLDCFALRALCAAATILNVAACSIENSAASGPALGTPQSVVRPAFASTIGAEPRSVPTIRPRRLLGLPYYVCPARGPLEYVADYNNNIIHVYAGNFKGQPLCGRITAGVSTPWGMYVAPKTHDLYVVNGGSGGVLVFHRGQTTAYNSYIDPTAESPADVVETNGTVVVSNLTQDFSLWKGSLSTWVEGPHGGRFVGNFQMADQGYGHYVTAENGVVYFDDLPNATDIGVIWRVSCPAGACGTQKQVGGVILAGPGGLALDPTGDLVVAESGAGKADTFELPNPVPASFNVRGAPIGIALDPVRSVLFVADGLNNNAAEYTYPGGLLIGTVPGDQGGADVGVAVDPD